MGSLGADAALESPGRATCIVYHARLSELGEPDRSIIDHSDLERALSFRRPADQGRCLHGAALLRLAVAAQRGVAVESVVVGRTCGRCGGAHGKPHVVGGSERCSLSHSGDLLVVAVSDSGELGVDVEEYVELDVRRLASRVYCPDELGSRLSSREFLQQWTRKESVLKATGDGLAVSMLDVEVEAPPSPPRFTRYRGRAAGPSFMQDLSIDPGYAATVTVLGVEQASVVVKPAESLLV